MENLPDLMEVLLIVLRGVRSVWPAQLCVHVDPFGSWPHFVRAADVSHLRVFEQAVGKWSSTTSSLWLASSSTSPCTRTERLWDGPYAVEVRTLGRRRHPRHVDGFTQGSWASWSEGSFVQFSLRVPPLESAGRPFRSTPCTTLITSPASA